MAQHLAFPSAAVVHETSLLMPPANQRKVYTKEQWEALKPIIERLWLAEKLPFRLVAEVLKNEYDFFPTYVSLSRMLLAGSKVLQFQH